MRMGIARKKAGHSALLTCGWPLRNETGPFNARGVPDQPESSSPARTVHRDFYAVPAPYLKKGESIRGCNAFPFRVKDMQNDAARVVTDASDLADRSRAMT
jgi:hypothetical protein